MTFKEYFNVVISEMIQRHPDATGRLVVAHRQYYWLLNGVTDDKAIFDDPYYDPEEDDWDDEE